MSSGILGLLPQIQIWPPRWPPQTATASPCYKVNLRTHTKFPANQAIFLHYSELQIFPQISIHYGRLAADVVLVHSAFRPWQVGVLRKRCEIDHDGHTPGYTGGPSPTPYHHPFPQTGCSQPPVKTCITNCSQTVPVTTVVCTDMLLPYPNVPSSTLGAPLSHKLVVKN